MSLIQTVDSTINLFIERPVFNIGLQIGSEAKALRENDWLAELQQQLGPAMRPDSEAAALFWYGAGGGKPGHFIRLTQTPTTTQGSISRHMSSVLHAVLKAGGVISQATVKTHSADL